MSKACNLIHRHARAGGQLSEPVVDLNQLT